jgi:hypothetical protein
MRKAMWIAAALGAMFVTSSALADEPAKKDGEGAAAAAPAPKKGGKNLKYGMAGCGLGSIVIGRGGGILQIFAVTTNATSYTQLYGITSGTSNCEDNDSGDKEDSARVYVHANREALAKDISRGSGSTISDLATIAGCADSKAVGTTLQHNFKAIFPSASVSNDAVTDSILSTLKSDASLQCSAIGS